MRRAAVVLLAGALSLAPVPGAAQLASRDVIAQRWAAIGDATLAALIAEALERNPDVRSIEARARGAEAERLHATLDLMPTVTATGGFTRQRFAGVSLPGAPEATATHGVWDAGVQVAWEVDAFGRGRKVRTGRGALLEAAEEAVADARVVIAAAVASAYFDLRGAQDRLEVARRNAENQRSTLQVTRDRLEAGRGTALDTDRAQAQLSSTLAAIPALEATVAAARHRLSSLTGREPGNALDAGLRIDSLTDGFPVEVTVPDVDLLLAVRPDVRGAEQQVTAADAFVGAARSAYLPRVAVVGAAGYTADAFEALGNSGTPRYAVGPVVSWPLLNLGRIKADVDAARAARSEAGARLEATRLRAREEILTAKEAYERGRASLVHLEEAAEASQRASELVRLRFAEGASDFLEVLDAERRLLESQDRLAQARTDVASALVAFYRALGDG